MGTASVNVDATLKDGIGTTVGTTKADFDATSLSLSSLVAPGDPCAVQVGAQERRITGLTANVTGDLSATATASGASVTITFHGTNVKVENIMYDAECVVTSYKLTLNGEADVSQTGGTGSSSFMVSFANFMMIAEVMDAFTEVQLNGAASSLCFGGTANLNTITALQIVTGQLCPDAGEINVLNTGTITFANGMVTINGTMVFPSCTDVGECLG